MRLIGHPLRRHRRSRGQALAEFAMIIPIFLTIFVAITEFSFMFTSYIDIGYASRDAGEVAAADGNTVGSDCAVIQRINNDIGTPANPAQVTEIDIYWVNTAAGNGSAVSGAVTTYTYDGADHTCTLPNGTTIYHHPFKGPAPDGYTETTRCNVNLGIGCLPTNGTTHNTVDTIAVKISYQYKWITPFPGLIFGAGGAGTGPLMSSTSIMRLEPIR